MILFLTSSLQKYFLLFIYIQQTQSLHGYARQLTKWSALQSEGGFYSERAGSETSLFVAEGVLWVSLCRTVFSCFR